ncbi:RiPP maturation radical SAM C-methyltransferase [Vibrio hangzhouensis]|uniref:RiPP maturation radical SAM C-methyltransferase n=1 Tax=Vibrio hangzhouensis TaxID=462991 RepID=UPI001C93AF15|nr:RiPP maturation radical SAM C-methyltransferase [Vibrio hangzhouensis]MBY6197725.1 RiPP maturation radical SAM C-methyltransferase [Vibrio hangzhouensis]
MMNRTDLILISLPFARADNLCIQIGCLKAYANQNKINTIARHYYKDLYSFLPRELIELLYSQNLGEFLSLALLFPEKRPAICRYIDSQLSGKFDTDSAITEMDNFLDHCLTDITSTLVEGQQRPVCGFTVSKQQIVTTLFFLTKLKRTHPDIVNIIGGAILTKEVARDLVASFEQLDFAVYGEGEQAILDFFQYRPFDNFTQASKVSNLVFRDNLGVVANPHKEFRRLDQLPIPDYDEYFDHYLKDQSNAIYPKISVETSRGCFYDKCTFCNLNTQWDKKYRAKTDQQVLEEITHQVARYTSLRVLFVDTNVANRYGLFKLLASSNMNLTCWGEVSGHVKRKHFLAMRAAGLTNIQIGVESFSTEMLSKYDKGVTAMRNMEMLKWCSELDINLYYNLIVESPEETEQAFAENLQALEFARHYQAPHIAHYVITFDSPYFKNLAKEGESKKVFSETFQALIPKEVIGILGPLLLNFVGTRPDNIDKQRTKQVKNKIAEWKKRYEDNNQRSGMVIKQSPEIAVITIRYIDLEEHITLPEEFMKLYTACLDEARHFDSLLNLGILDQYSLATALQQMVDLQIMYQSDEQYLALACSEKTFIECIEKYRISSTQSIRILQV